MTEERFAELTVQIWRKWQHVNELKKTNPKAPLLAQRRAEIETLCKLLAVDSGAALAEQCAPVSRAFAGPGLLP